VNYREVREINREVIDNYRGGRQNSREVIEN